MSVAEFFVVVFCCLYTKYFWSLIFSKNRQEIIEVNKKMDKLRKIPVKSVDEQKEFINLRYPKTESFKFKWKMVPKFAFILVIYMLLFKGYNYLISSGFEYINYELKIWQALTFIMIAPIIINFILKRFNLQKQDISAFF